MTYPPPEDPSQSWQAVPPPPQQPYGQMPPPPAGQPYPQQPYGYPPAPGYSQYPPQQTTNGIAIAALVCGIVGVFIAQFILGPLAIIFGGIGLSRTKSGASGRGNAIAGIVLGCVAIAIFVIAIIWAENHGGFIY